MSLAPPLFGHIAIALGVPPRGMRAETQQSKAVTLLRLLMDRARPSHRTAMPLSIVLGSEERLVYLAGRGKHPSKVKVVTASGHFPCGEKLTVVELTALLPACLSEADDGVNWTVLGERDDFQSIGGYCEVVVSFPDSIMVFRLVSGLK